MVPSLSHHASHPSSSTSNLSHLLMRETKVPFGSEGCEDGMGQSLSVLWLEEIRRDEIILEREHSRQILSPKNMRTSSPLVHVSHAVFSSRAEPWVVPVRASSVDTTESTSNTGELQCSKIYSSGSGWGRHYYINDL